MLSLFLFVNPSQKNQSSEDSQSHSISNLSSDDEGKKIQPTTSKKNKLSKTQEFDLLSFSEQPQIDPLLSTTEQQKFINENLNIQYQIDSTINMNESEKNLQERKPELVKLAKNVYKATQSQQISPRKKISKMRTTNQLEIEIMAEEVKKKKSKTKGRDSFKISKNYNKTLNPLQFQEFNCSDDNSCRDSESVISVDSSDPENHSYYKIKQRHFYKDQKIQSIQKFKRVYKQITQEKFKNTQLCKFIKDKYVKNKHSKFTAINGEILKLQLNFKMKLDQEIISEIEMLKFYNLKTSKTHSVLKEESFNFFAGECDVTSMLLDLYWIEVYFQKIQGYTNFFEFYIKGKDTDKSVFIGKSTFLENKFNKFSQKNQLNLAWIEFKFIYERYIECFMFFRKKHPKYPIEHKSWINKVEPDNDRIKFLLVNRFKEAINVDSWFNSIKHSEDDIVVLFNDIHDYANDEINLFNAKNRVVRIVSEDSENNSQHLNTNNKGYTKPLITTSIILCSLIFVLSSYTLINSKYQENDQSESFVEKKVYK